MKRASFILFFAMLALIAAAQSRDKAKKLFNSGKFEEAKPMFQKLLKGSPRNSEYNYWYAACCIETGDTVEVLDMLEFAASRKIVNAYRYLGDYYYGKSNFPKAEENYNAFLEKTKVDSLRLEYSKRAVKASDAARMVKNTENVCFVDSFVVSKDNFLAAYRVGNDVGRITKNSIYFKDEALPGFLYETERGMDIFFSDYDEKTDSLMKIYHNSKADGEWGSPRMLAGFNTFGNDDYPFMASDGVTLYFASDGNGSIGGYDIFMTRMDTESGSFLRPDNIGMPFNSTANDYMLVINEVANLGWFATDRNQPEGLVCVYVFVPNESRVKYDYEALGYEKMASYAAIASIAETQANENVVRKARQQMAVLIYSHEEESEGEDFLFVIDDMRDYTKLNDFRSEKAKKMFVNWRKRTAQHQQDLKALELKRDAYADAGKAEKQRMGSSILELEGRVERQHTELERMEWEIRRLEHEVLYK